MLVVPKKRSIGTAELRIPDSVPAGSYQEFSLVYKAGFFGIDDSGSIKVCYRHVTDMGEPQFHSPSEPHYVSVTTTADADLTFRFDPKGNVRPWGQTIYIKVQGGYLRQGDEVVLVFGDRKQRSPGIRMQTFCEKRFGFKVLVDPVATYTYVDVPLSKTVEIAPGPPSSCVVTSPTVRRVGERFSVRVKLEDVWGNPTSDEATEVRLGASAQVRNLPSTLRLSGEPVTMIHDLSVSEPLAMRFTVSHPSIGEAVSNPLIVVSESPQYHFWADLHGQSEETIGTKTAQDYFRFAKDLAGLDVAAHQGNDFQITGDFWNQLQSLTAEFLKEGRFVTFPGYEWSANTALGGDHNVFFPSEGSQIRRSSHALVQDGSDVDTDCHHIMDLFGALENEEALVFAHAGGRFSDMSHHSPRLQRSVELHSAWGTFEWLLEDALKKGYRLGIVCNSDGHKGRPGASYPGASTFGSYGGLTCIRARSLTREAIWEACQLRHHYGTTGHRPFLQLSARLPRRGFRFRDDPAANRRAGTWVDEAEPGDIVALVRRSVDSQSEVSEDSLVLRIDYVGTAPVYKVEIRNGLETVYTIRPFEDADVGKRIRVTWGGANVRGRGRQVNWDGSARLRGNAFLYSEAVNFWNAERTLELRGSDTLLWRSSTTGGFAGFNATLQDAGKGVLEIDTPQVKAAVEIDTIRGKERYYDRNGVGRHLRISGLPDENACQHVLLDRTVPLRNGSDNALYVRIEQEDGHVAWSSPIYLIEERVNEQS